MQFRSIFVNIYWYKIVFPGSSAVERPPVKRLAVGSIPTRGASQYEAQNSARAKREQVWRKTLVFISINQSLIIILIMIEPKIKTPIAVQTPQDKATILKIITIINFIIYFRKYTIL